MSDAEEHLREENRLLHERIKVLESQLAFLNRHAALTAGITGEALIRDLSTGALTKYGESFDLLTKTGAKIEVKYSDLNAPVSNASTRRWAWGKIFGESGAKDFDAMVLVGVKDPRYSSQYKDQQSPYVIFVVPRDKLDPLVIQNGRTRSINLTTNPAKARSAAAPLYHSYQVTEAELKVLLA